MVGGSVLPGRSEEQEERLLMVYVTYDFSWAATASGGILVVRREEKQFIRSSEMLCYGET